MNEKPDRIEVVKSGVIRDYPHSLEQLVFDLSKVDSSTLIKFYKLLTIFLIQRAQEYSVKKHSCSIAKKYYDLWLNASFRNDEAKQNLEKILKLDNKESQNDEPVNSARTVKNSKRKNSSNS